MTILDLLILAGALAGFFGLTVLLLRWGLR